MHSGLSYLPTYQRQDIFGCQSCLIFDKVTKEPASPKKSLNC